jgi:hypothetical protein
MFEDGGEFSFLDHLAGVLRHAVVPIFVQQRTDKLLLQGFGSGFLISIGHRDYLVTARHVAEELNEYSQRYLLINERLVALSNISFAVDRENDLAVAALCDCWFQERDLAAIPSIEYDPAVTSAKILEPGIFFVQGYPGSQNIIKARYGRAKRELLSLTLDKPTLPPAKTKVVSSIALRYEEARMLDSLGKPKFRPVALNGMSGGLIFQLCVAEGSDGAPYFLSRPVGVLLEWHRDEEIVVGASMEAVNQLLPQAQPMHAA